MADFELPTVRCISEADHWREEAHRMRAAALMAYGGICVLNTSGQADGLIAVLDDMLFPNVIDTGST
jgi:hypothetical protein